MIVAEEVTGALADGGAVVALESTLLAHGLPAPRNREVAGALEDAVRAAGAVPATIAMMDGVPVVGLNADQLDRVCEAGADIVKLSRRDLGPAAALGRDGATTVAATAALAHAAGIGVFATGGLGGVHRPVHPEHVTWDVSADLGVLAETPVLVVCSGVKSIVDIGATLEVLETHSVPVIGFGTDVFPAFYLRDSGFGVPWRVDSPVEAADVVLAHRAAPGTAGAVLANPVPAEHELDRELHDRLLAEGQELLRRKGIQGKDVTPALLEHFHEASGGASLDTNAELVLANTRLAAEIAVALATRG
ncbi:pseudouridine-5'-phosphate glycosidase [Herbihabitans rhizosphaerae]|uniref:Pseudouridine-5'-phosphate glycosidase n=1 Tax=Herbihabitans rhizosphaerae TaxID=1872711 RepID=A0A4Q7KIR1_9PSEU|nr:pseudouridine-5'-phosphate glycosidase [Herbihabitans rhizosphaerae]RZS34484.1 pseudouridine-5'-phosphate glycosidase [Herbihabitans rhizosphaerae]